MAEEITSIQPENPEPQETPTQTPDRTSEQFDKLTSTNKELKKERDEYKNVLDSLSAQPQPQPLKPVQKAPAMNEMDAEVHAMVDKEGFLDGNKLVKVLSTLDKKTKDAESLARKVAIQAKKVSDAQRQQQKTVKMQKVHDKYPQLDPQGDSFDETFYEAVRNDLIGQMMNGKEDPMEAADKWNAIFAKQTGKEVAVSKEKEEIEEKKSQKEQINAVRPRSSSMAGYYADTEEEDLRKKMRSGKKGAVAEALTRYEKRNSK